VTSHLAVIARERAGDPVRRGLSLCFECLRLLEFQQRQWHHLPGLRISTPPPGAAFPSVKGKWAISTSAWDRLTSSLIRWTSVVPPVLQRATLTA